MVMSFIESLGPWVWFVLGAAFLSVEIIAPGTFLLWVGIAAVAVGLLTFAVDLSWQTQLLAFALLSPISVLVWWKLAHNKSQTEPSTLNRRAARNIGRELVLEEPIVNGQGRIRIDDTFWRIQGPDCPSNTKVRIIASQSALLIVEPIQ